MWRAATWHQWLSWKVRLLLELGLTRCCLPQQKRLPAPGTACIAGVTLSGKLIDAAGDELDGVVGHLFTTAVSGGLGQADALTQKRLGDAFEIIAGDYISWHWLCSSIGKACS